MLPSPRSTPPRADASLTRDALAELSIEQLIRRRVSLMLARLDDAPVADLYDLVMGEAERGLLGLVLERCQGNRGQAAEQLGLHRNTLRQRLDRVGLAARVRVSREPEVQPARPRRAPRPSGR
jgi:DNA-binding protein Fis